MTYLDTFSVQNSGVLLNDYLQLVSNHFDNIEYFRKVDIAVNNFKNDKVGLDKWLNENKS